MAYQQTAVLTVNDIPAAIASFAAANGWTVNNSNPAQPIFSHSSKSGSLSFRIRASISGTNNQNKEVIIEDTGSTATSKAVMRSPKLAGSNNNPTVPNPTSVSMFTGIFPEPFIAVAVAFGVNLYRHMYLGFMDIIGDYTGGEVIACTAGSSSVATNTLDYQDYSVFKHLFKARHNTSLIGKVDGGGVRVVHSDNPTPWRVFNSNLNSVTPFAQFVGDEVIGGYGDGYNDVMVARGQSSYAGAVILTPCNLLLSKPITNDVRFKPIGNPSGVRLVNMRDLEPGQQILISSESWRVYPAVSKRNETLLPASSAGGFYRQFESSVNLGYAYREV